MGDQLRVDGGLDQAAFFDDVGEGLVAGGEPVDEVGDGGDSIGWRHLFLAAVQALA
ncbi:hypothetical protein D3C87_2197100 [compost metagenome]